MEHGTALGQGPSHSPSTLSGILSPLLLAPPAASWPSKATGRPIQSSRIPGLRNHPAWIRLDLKTVMRAEPERANTARKPDRNTIFFFPPTNKTVGLNLLARTV